MMTMEKKLPDWVLHTKEKVCNWLEELMVPGEPFGRFRFAPQGCVYMPYDIISVHFAADIYKKLNMIDALADEQKKQWMDLSMSWRDPETGEVRDPDGIEKGVQDNDDPAVSVNALRRNLNRCCRGVFNCGEDQPVLQPDVKDFLEIEKMYTVFDAHPWETGSWAAGAQCAHYIHAMLQWKKAGHDEFDEAIEKAVEYLYSKQHADDGTFGGRSQNANNKIGGILKIYARLYATMGLEIRYPERIIDTAISLLRSGEINKGNCPAHNALIVLLMCSNVTEYRRDEVQQEALISLGRDIRPHRKLDGAFCCDPSTSEYACWGVNMVKAGYDQGEIHTTNLMLQALRVIAELLGLEKDLGFAASEWH